MNINRRRIKRKRPNIAIIGNPVNTLGRDVFLCKFINILAPLVNELLVIAGDFRCKNALPPNVRTVIIRGDEKREPLFVRAFKFFLRELRYSIALIKNAPNIDLVIIFGAERTIPTEISKLLNKKVLLHVGGRFSLHASAVHKSSLLGLGKYIMPAIGQIEESICLFLADGIIVESDSVLKTLKLERYRSKVFTKGLTYSDISVPCHLLKESMSRKRQYIGFIGRLSREKGIMEFLESIPLILSKKPDLKFLIVGDGPLCGYVEEFIKRNNLSSNVCLLGFVEHEKLADIYYKLKLLIMPSYSEGVPNVLLEAMACGVPVLASPVGGIPSMIIDGKTGFLLKSRKPSDIAESILKIITNFGLLKVSVECCRYASEYFSLRSARKRYKEILDTVIKASKK